MTTAGLRNVGAANGEFGLHGRISNLAAEDVGIPARLGRRALSAGGVGHAAGMRDVRGAPRALPHDFDRARRECDPAARPGDEPLLPGGLPADSVSLQPRLSVRVAGTGVRRGGARGDSRATQRPRRGWPGGTASTSRGRITGSSASTTACRPDRTAWPGLLWKIRRSESVSGSNIRPDAAEFRAVEKLSFGRIRARTRADQRECAGQGGGHRERNGPENSAGRKRRVRPDFPFRTSFACTPVKAAHPPSASSPAKAACSGMDFEGTFPQAPGS